MPNREAMKRDRYQPSYQGSGPEEVTVRGLMSKQPTWVRDIGKQAKRFVVE